MAIRDIAKTLNKKKLVKPEMREMAISQIADLYKSWELTPYNPDELITKKGYKIIKKMMTDGHVKGCVNTLKMSTLGSGWEILPASDDPTAIEHAEFINSVIDNCLTGSFYDDLLNVLNGLENGWSVSEKNWKIIDKGRWKGKIGLASIKDKDPEEYSPITDSFGNLTGIINTGNQSADYGRKYPINKFIVHTFWKKYENIFGESVLRAVYRHWWSKDNIIKFWNIYLNKFGMPTVVAKYTSGASDEEQKEVIEILKTIQTETGVTIPDDFDLKLLEAMRRGDAGYESAINLHNAEMSKAIFGQTLTTEQGSIGSQALGNVHFDILVFYVEHLQRLLQEVIDEQLIRQLIDFNFSDVTEYPYMQMKSIVKDDKHKQVELFNKAVKDGTIKETTIDDENHIRDMLNFGDRELTDREQQLIDDQSKRKEEEPVPPIPTPTPEDETDEGDLVESSFEEFRKPKRKLTSYEKKVDFETVFNTMEDNQAKTVDKMTDVVRRQLDDVLAKIKRRDLINKKTSLREVDKLDLSYLRDMRLILAENMRDTYLDGRSQANAEVNKAKQQFAAPELKLEPLQPKEMLKEFEGKAFIITGAARDDILKTIKMHIYNGRQKGKTLKQIVFNIEEDMKGWLKSGVLVPDADGVMRAHRASRIETIVRTNISEAYNQGRKAEFVAMGDDVPAYQYSAILDSRTRDDHAAMDLKIYLKDDPIWDRWTPPNGFNCRCILVPVLKEEEFSVDKKIKADPDKGFD